MHTSALLSLYYCPLHPGGVQAVHQFSIDNRFCAQFCTGAAAINDALRTFCTWAVCGGKAMRAEQFQQRQERVARAGLVPHLQHFITTNSELEPLALQVPPLTHHHELFSIPSPLEVFFGISLASFA